MQAGQTPGYGGRCTPKRKEERNTPTARGISSGQSSNLLV